MQEKCTIINRCFTDEFDLPLQEGTADDYYTVDEIKNEVNERITKLAALSKKYTIASDSIVRYEIIDKSKNLAEVELVDTNKYVFRITKQAARKRNAKYLDTIIYHELCHVLQVDFLLNTNIIYFEEGKLYYDKEQEDVVALLYDADNGHTKLWYSFVKLVNAAFVVNPPVDRFLTGKDASDLFLENTFSRESIPVTRTKFVDDFSYLLEKDSSKEA